ncbi:hypothetical protein [Streptomyces sp. NPDC093544]|uniref:hypothetical protein n=1 Tax=Streptomyces sp. NPDC093544 TaxID=3155200 RepID=UPI003417E88A
MHELTALVGLLGAGTCLAERLAGPTRDWGPPAVVLAVMALMTCGVDGAALAAGACAVAAAGLWTALAGPPGGRGPVVVDLATMALLTAGASRSEPDAAPGHLSGMNMPGASGTYNVRFFLLLVVCWALARAGVHLIALVRSAGPTPADGARGGGRAAVREAGSAAMVVAMAAMLA